VVIVDVCVDGMGGFRGSNMNHTKKLAIKKQKLEPNCEGDELIHFFLAMLEDMVLSGGHLLL